LATDLRADTARDPLCADKGSPIDVGKALAVSIERELRESTKVSDAEEARIGKRLEVAASHERSFAGKWDLPEDVRKYGGYLGGLVQHIAKGKTRPGIQYRVHVVRRPEFNAAALPGGALMVFTGLLEGPQAVRDEAELVAVLGHEIAHVEKRHTIAAYQYAKAILGDGDQGMIVMKILTMPLSTERELEADEYGLELAVKSQYDPQAAVNLWRRHAAGDHGGPMGALNQILEEVLRSHPRPAIRACRAMQKVNWAHDHSPWDRLYDGRTNLHTRVIGPSRPY
jgi:predicted Zn-dependent protease